MTVLIGHSGVGKSTLVNALVPGTARATGVVNDVTGRGRHTSSSAVAVRAARRRLGGRHPRRAVVRAGARRPGPDPARVPRPGRRAPASARGAAATTSRSAALDAFVASGGAGPCRTRPGWTRCAGCCALAPAPTSRRPHRGVTNDRRTGDGCPSSAGQERPGGDVLALLAAAARHHDMVPVVAPAEPPSYAMAFTGLGIALVLVLGLWEIAGSRRHPRPRGRPRRRGRSSSGTVSAAFRSTTKTGTARGRHHARDLVLQRARQRSSDTGGRRSSGCSAPPCSCTGPVTGVLWVFLLLLGRPAPVRPQPVRRVDRRGHRRGVLPHRHVRLRAGADWSSRAPGSGCC